MRVICYNSENKPLKSFYQYDTNQIISLSGITTSPIPVVHFCNRLSSTALVVTPIVEGDIVKVPVPNILLQQAETIVAYVYEETPDDGSRTTYTITIPVVPRPRPDDYEYSENIDYRNTVKSTTVRTIKTVTKSEYKELEESDSIDCSTLYIVVPNEETEG